MLCFGIKFGLVLWKGRPATAKTGSSQLLRSDAPLQIFTNDDDEHSLRKPCIPYETGIPTFPLLRRSPPPLNAVDPSTHPVPVETAHSGMAGQKALDFQIPRIY